MSKASQFKKPNNERSLYPSGHVAKPPKGSKQPRGLSDNNRVVHSEEPNPDDG